MTVEAVGADLERRFGGLRRLWGDGGYEAVRRARVAVIGIGGVGSWAAEALARCGVAQLVLVDLDQIGESNINRQIQALGSSVGAAKVDVMAARVRDIHPGCDVHAVEQFAEEGNWPGLLRGAVDIVIDACDQGRAKLLLARWSRDAGVPMVTVGAAGGKTQPQRVRVADLAQVTHDPLLARLRQQLRKSIGASGPIGANERLGLICVYSEEAVALPSTGDDACSTDGSLNCHGYGSTVAVTATFGMTAAEAALAHLRARRGVLTEAQGERARPCVSTPLA
ncbi:tRNA threonylcarbamoyladenosine dehydratase [Leptothrix discophora]|uniref:tRNA threonylcarbamoyladenosine dehydratase n=1 Tax=Leptothrix discophora TaxID=89 RepID=A0ABT9FZC3_LEPDI|nr:tRNA threonylcarbamoyladenosine dehydratase [Leptothrix discophora]MDP4299501.1 tRNA threonylcarbamoyladenosine dehydratase [Leptothrix discophora]